MKFLGGGGAAVTASGSIGGQTYSHNRYGAYIRRKGIPVNTRSALQVVARARFTQGVIGWFGLTAGQRDAWNTYAANVPVTDALGQTINLTGQNMYLRTVTAMLRAGLTPVTAAPTIYNTGDVDATLAITAAVVSSETIDISFNDALDWCDEDGAALLVAMSRPQSVTRSFNGQPERVAASIPGDNTTPITSPQTIDVSSAGYTLSAGNVIRLATRIIRADGRVSSKFYSNTYTITA